MEPATLAIVGIGNPLAGDDGAGLAVVERLRLQWGQHPELLLYTLEGDLLEIADHLHRASRFLFVDAILAEPPGRLLIPVSPDLSPAPSQHQTQIATTMAMLAALKHIDPFPQWQIWGISIRLPEVAGTSLSPAVEAGVQGMVKSIDQELSTLLSADW